MTSTVNHKGIELTVTYDIWEMNNTYQIEEILYNGYDVFEIYDQNHLIDEIEELLKDK